MRRPLASTALVAVALPLRIAQWIAWALGAASCAARLRALTAGIPLVAYMLTGVVWVPVFVSGIFYPILDAGNLKNSWGGPTLIGAWVTHLALGVGLLFAVSFLFALWRPPKAISRRDSSG